MFQRIQARCGVTLIPTIATPVYDRHVNTRLLYILTGMVWGLLLGVLGGVFAVAAGAGFSWLYLFGDAPWPTAAGWLIPALGLGVFAIVLIICIALGLRAGRQAAVTGPETAAGLEVAARRHASARRLCATGVLLALILIGVLAARLAGQENTRKIADRRAAGFETLQFERQRLAEISVSRPPRPMSYDLEVRTRGTRGGAYEIAWALRSSGFKEALAAGAAQVTLQPGDNRTSLPSTPGRSLSGITTSRSAARSSMSKSRNFFALR